MEFTVFENAKKEKIDIIDVNNIFFDAAKVKYRYKGHEKINMLCYGGGHKKPFLRINDYDGKVLHDIVLTDEMIEYIWDKIGKPKTGLLFSHTKFYKDNYED